MELSIVEQLMTMGSKFYVFDRSGYKKYSINGDSAALGRGIIIYNRNRSEKLQTIKKDRNSDLLTYNLYDKGNVIIGNVKKLQGENNYIYTGKSSRFSVCLTDIVNRTYIIKDNENICGTISKIISLKGDSYKLEYNNDVDEVLFVSLVIIIDMIRFYTE